MGSRAPCNTWQGTEHIRASDDGKSHIVFELCHSNFDVKKSGLLLSPHCEWLTSHRPPDNVSMVPGTEAHSPRVVCGEQSLSQNSKRKWRGLAEHNCSATS